MLFNHTQTRGQRSKRAVHILIHSLKDGHRHIKHFQKKRKNVTLTVIHPDWRERASAIWPAGPGWRTLYSNGRAGCRQRSAATVANVISELDLPAVCRAVLISTCRVIRARTILTYSYDIWHDGSL